MTDLTSITTADIKKFLRAPAMKGFFISNVASLASTFIHDKYPWSSKIIQFLTAVYTKKLIIDQSQSQSENISQIRKEISAINSKIDTLSSQVLKK